MVKGEDLRIGDNLKVVYVGGEEKFFTITALDDIFYRDAHSTLPAGETETYAEISDLDPPTGQLYFIYKIETESNVKIYLKQPAATNRWGTNKAPEGGLLIDLTATILNGRRVNIWIAEDYPPNVQIVNDTNVTITPVLWWKGRRFGVKEITEEEAKPYTPVRIGGIVE